jgi:PPOX class probable F420-dependent enzyme
MSSHRTGLSRQLVMSTFTDHLEHQRNVLLTTYKRDGTPVGTAVHVAVEGDQAYIRTYGKAWKWKRVRNHPGAEIAPSTVRGKVTGPSIAVTGRILEGEEARAAARAIRRKYPILHGVLIPLSHRLMRTPTIHMAFVPRGGSDSPPAAEETTLTSPGTSARRRPRVASDALPSR